MARLSDKRSVVICLAKPEISLIKVVRTAVWETMVAPTERLGEVARLKVHPARLRAEGGRVGGGQAEGRQVRLPVLTPAKAVQ